MPYGPVTHFKSIEEIKAYTWIGNHHSDWAAFNGVDAFAANKDNSVADRAEALRIASDAGMGCGRDEHLSDEDLLAQFEADWEANKD